MVDDTSLSVVVFLMEYLYCGHFDTSNFQILWITSHHLRLPEDSKAHLWLKLGLFSLALCGWISSAILLDGDDFPQWSNSDWDINKH